MDRYAAPLILLLTVVAYAPVMRAGYIWDDEVYVTDNPTVRAADGVRRIWTEPQSNHQYYPLAFTTYWLEYRLWASAPAGYHIVNVLLHAGNAVLMWLVLRRLRVAGALLAALVFAVHPIEVEAVAWIAQRKTLLATMFGLLTVLTWLKEPVGAPWPRAIVAVVLFVCALLSKTAIAPLPVVLALLAWMQRRRLRLADGVTLAAMLACAAGLALVTVWRERLEPLTDVQIPALTLLDRVVVAARAIVFYAGKLLWPTDLAPIYPQWSLREDAWWSVLCVGAAAGTAVAAWLGRHRWGRGHLVALAAFVIMLAPTLGIVSFNFMRFSYVADHFVYAPSIAFIAWAAAMTVVWAQRRTIPSQVTIGASAALVLLLGGLTWQQTRIYETPETFWRTAISRNEQAWTAYNALGYALLINNDIEGALQAFAKAREIKPEFAGAYGNTGLAYLRSNRLDDAITWFAAAVRIQPDAGSYNSWGVALDKQGKLDEAIARYEKALELRPDFGGAHLNLARALWQQKRFGEVSRHLRAALQAGLEDPAAHRLLATLLMTQGDMAQAVEHLASAARLSPGDAEIQRELAQAQAALQASRGAARRPE